MSDIWFCEKQNSDVFQQKSAGVKPKKELPRDRNGSIKHDGVNAKYGDGYDQRYQEPRRIISSKSTGKGKPLRYKRHPNN
ncbi:MAG: hypothetical protein NPMRD1_430001 [Nitrosopumilales archaeon]|nr:MAG: hypothetical protein NPMRD1_430001 [Nitrosopumilales archaeon]